MNEVIASRADRDFYDLHVDDISPRFEAKSSWVKATVECLQAAVLIRNSQRLPFTIAAGLSLQSHETPYGLPPEHLDQITEELDDSPPSLYLFEKNHEPWLDDRDFRELPGQYQPPLNIPIRSFVREWLDENDGEFRRSFWLAS